MSLFRQRWRDASLGSKLAVLFSAILALLVLSMNVVNIQNERVIFRESLEDQARLLLTTLSLTMRDSLYYIQLDELQDVARVVDSDDAIAALLIFNPSGVLLVDSRTFDQPQFATETDPLGVRVIQLAEDDLMLDWQTEYLVAGRTIWVGNRLVGAVAIYFPTAPFQQKVLTALGQGVVVALTILVIGIAASRWLAQRLVAAPIRHLVEVSSAMAGGHTDQRVEFKGNDEIGRLGQSFNQMADAIDSLLSNLESQAAIAQSRLFQAMESMSEGFALYDAEDRLVLGNQEYRSIMPELSEHIRPGLSFRTRAELIAKHGLIITEPEMKRSEWVEWRVKAHKDPAGSLEVKLTDGRCFLIREYLTPDGETASFYTDITARKEFEDQLQELVIIKERARLAAEAANTAKSAFLANMSHELRTPLNAIIGFTRIIRRKAEGHLDEKQIENLDKVQSSGEHLLNLINTILDIAKIEAGRMEVQVSAFNLSSVIELCLTTITPLVKPGVSLEKQIEDELPSMDSDPEKIKQILLNLLGNALKFTSEGKVVLGASMDPATHQVKISIADTGIGMTEEVLGHIFEEFQQADSNITRQYGGTGLGLAISRNLANLLGGSLTATSIVGEGSTFLLTLPLQYQAESQMQLQRVAEAQAINQQ